MAESWQDGGGGATRRPPPPQAPHPPPSCTGARAEAAVSVSGCPDRGPVGTGSRGAAAWKPCLLALILRPPSAGCSRWSPSVAAVRTMPPGDMPSCRPWCRGARGETAVHCKSPRPLGRTSWVPEETTLWEPDLETCRSAESTRHHSRIAQSQFTVHYAWRHSVAWTPILTRRLSWQYWRLDTRSRGPGVNERRLLGGGERPMARRGRLTRVVGGEAGPGAVSSRHPVALTLSPSSHLTLLADHHHTASHKKREIITGLCTRDNAHIYSIPRVCYYFKIINPFSTGGLGCLRAAYLLAAPLLSSPLRLT